MKTDLRTLVAEGNDSIVYRLGDSVLKEYRALEYQQVERYVELTERAGTMLASSPYVAQISIDGQVCQLILRECINIDRLETGASGNPVTRSRYVHGANLARLMLPRPSFAKFADDCLSESKFRDFAEAMNSYLRQESSAGTVLREEFEWHVARLSSTLESALDVSGLYVGMPNIKLQPRHDDPRSIDMILTDIALFIDRVTFPEAH